MHSLDNEARAHVEGVPLYMYGIRAPEDDDLPVAGQQARDVPDDILHKADAVIERGYNEGLVDAVARAILAERKRCADIAKLARNDAEFYGNPEMRRAASLIAHRIESRQ